MRGCPNVLQMRYESRIYHSEGDEEANVVSMVGTGGEFRSWTIPHYNRLSAPLTLLKPGL